jgi:hypothetical protein
MQMKPGQSRINRTLLDLVLVPFELVPEFAEHEAVLKSRVGTLAVEGNRSVSGIACQTTKSGSGEVMLVPATRDHTQQDDVALVVPGLAANGDESGRRAASTTQG